jgi:chemotaxis protein methyltransferase CheR
LITGHSELQGQDMTAFKLLLFPESVVYQRSTEAAANASTLGLNLPLSVTHPSPATPPAVQPIPSARVEPQAVAMVTFPKATVARDTAAGLKAEPTFLEPLEDALEKARHLLLQGRYTALLSTTEQLLQQKTQDQSEVYYLRAQAYANQGDSGQAIAACEQALHFQPEFLEPLYLLAQIAEEQQNLAQAKSILKKVLYLDPTAIAAYIDLGLLYAKDGEPGRAQKMFHSAWELLHPLAADQSIQYRGLVSVRSLQGYLKTLLRDD